MNEVETTFTPSSTAKPIQNADRVGVILVNTGTPEDPSRKAIRKYLNKFLMNPRIRPMNRVLWWVLLHVHVLGRRSERSVAKYEHLWTPEGFPFNDVHKRIEHGLNSYYQEQKQNVCVRCAMSFGTPSVKDTLSELKRVGCTRLVVLPLYPQSAYSTTGVVRDEIERVMHKMRWAVSFDVIDNYHSDEYYLHAIAASVRHAGFDPTSDDRLFFSYHSIPIADIEAGDTYELQVDASSLGIVEDLGIDRNRWTIAFQSRFDSGRIWLSPFARQSLMYWAEDDTDSRVFVVCPNFAVDCLETDYEIRYELEPEYLIRKHEVARDVNVGKYDSGNLRPRMHKNHPLITEPIDFDSEDFNVDNDEFVYVPCLNKSKEHLKVLIHVLEPYIERS